MSSVNFVKDEALNKQLLDWHKGLEQRKGDRAMLRRASDPMNAFLSTYAHQLSFELKKHNEKVRLQTIPEIASVLAHITKADASKSLPVQLAQRREGSEQPVFSELRFRRLLQCEDRESLCVHLRRAIAQLRGTADIFTTANTIYWWGELQRKELAFAYFSARARLPTS